MRVIRDEEADAVYIDLLEYEPFYGCVKHTIVINEDVLFDVDKDGNLVGIYMQNFTAVMQGL